MQAKPVTAAIPNEPVSLATAIVILTECIPIVPITIISLFLNKHPNSRIHSKLFLTP